MDPADHSTEDLTGADSSVNGCEFAGASTTGLPNEKGKYIMHIYICT